MVVEYSGARASPHDSQEVPTVPSASFQAYIHIYTYTYLRKKSPLTCYIISVHEVKKNCGGDIDVVQP